MTDNNKTLIDELEKRLLWYREEATEEEFDAEAVDAICTMLQKLSPEEPHRTKEEAYQNIMNLISSEEEEPGKSGEGGADAKKPDGNSTGRKRRFPLGRRSLRAAIIFIAVVGVLASLNMVTYARENKSLFTMILERVGVLKIVKDETVGGDLVDAGNTTKEFYDSWGDLDPELKERIAVPAYIPDGYSLFGIRCWNFMNRKNIQSDYYDQGNGHLLVEITLWEDNEDHYRETLMDETIYTLLSEYSDKNTLYYEYEDEYICIAFLGNNFYRISGNMELEEMIKIREGLGDTKQN